MNFKLILLTITSLFTGVGYGALPGPSDFNVYTINNIGQNAANPYSNSDFQGLVGAGGGVYLQNFSLNTNGGQSGPLSLYVNQDLSLNSVQINNGGLEAGKSITSSNSSIYGNVNGGGNLTGSGGSIQGNVALSGQNNSSITVSGTVTQNKGSYTPTVNLAQISSFFLNASSSYASMTQSPWITSAIAYGTLSLSGLKAGLNIVNLSLATENTLSQIQFSGDSNAIVVFNFTGNKGANSQNLQGVTLNGLANDAVLFNVINASNLTMSGGPYTSVLAPNSNLTFTNGNVKGNLIANNLYGTGQVDIDQGLFIGFSTVPTPEPSAYFLTASFLGIALMIFRKKNSQPIPLVKA